MRNELGSVEEKMTSLCSDFLAIVFVSAIHQCLQSKPPFFLAKGCTRKCGFVFKDF